MNRIKTSLMVGAAACLFGMAANAAGTAHTGSESQIAKHRSDLQQSINELDNLFPKPAAGGPAVAPMRAPPTEQEVRTAAQKVIDQANKVVNDKSPGVQSIDEVPSAKNNFKGDTLRWPTAVTIYQMKDQTIDFTQPYCLDPGNTVYGKSKDFTAGPKPDGDGGDKPAPNYLHVQVDQSGGLFLHGGNRVAKPKKPDATGMTECVADSAGAAVALKNSDEFFVEESDAEGAEREGFDFGTLVVPFKFELSDKSAVTASASLGAYLGYRIPFLKALDLRPVLFAGLSEVPVEQTGDDGKATTETLAGFSYGIGVIGTIKDSFSWGLIVGADHVDSIQQYKYQDKPWVSLVLGLSLEQ